MTPEATAYKNMVARCMNPRIPNYRNYGARGICVSRRWLGPKGFGRFIQDMGPRPSDRHSLERKDNDRGYSPSNCVWATRAEQNRNNRRAVLLTHDAQTKNLIDWAKETGVSQDTISRRIKRGWTVEDALTTPSTRTNRKRHYAGHF